MNEDINTIRDVLLDEMQHGVNADKINALLALRRLEKRLEEEDKDIGATFLTRDLAWPSVSSEQPESEPVSLGTIYYNNGRATMPALPDKHLDRVCRHKLPETRIEWHPALPKDPYVAPFTEIAAGFEPKVFTPDNSHHVRAAWIKWRREIVDPIRKEQA